MAKPEQPGPEPDQQDEGQDEQDFTEYADEVDRLREDQRTNLEAIGQIEEEQERLAQELSERQKLARLHAAALAGTDGDDA